jgi:hypothetical protein
MDQLIHRQLGGKDGSRGLAERMLALFQREDIETWSGCVVSATPTKVRWGWMRRVTDAGYNGR